jgi:hypothetical protein
VSAGVGWATLGPLVPRAIGDSAGTEIRRLKDCISDLLSVSAIRAIARGSEPGHIIGALLEVLVGTLRVHLAYAEFKVTRIGAPVVLARFSQRPTSNELPQEIRATVDAWLGDRTQDIAVCHSLPDRGRRSFPSSSHPWVAFTDRLAAGVLVARRPSDAD